MTTRSRTRVKVTTSDADNRVQMMTLVKTEEEVADMEDLIVGETPRKRQKRTTNIKTPVKSEHQSPVKTPKATTTPRKAKPIRQNLDVPHPAPKDWEIVYDLISKQRRTFIAPVDTVGCERNRETDLPPRTKRFHVLVSLMLSSQTKDPVTSAAVDNLHNNLPGGLTLESILASNEVEIDSCINKVGFHNRKTVYLMKAAEKLRDEFGGDIPKTIDELCSLPGVGPKMGYIALSCAWDINAGIGVDVHVHRITNRLGWHEKETVMPEQTRLNLQSWLPKVLHTKINKILVGFGQVICLPVGPRCDLCSVGQANLCPSKVKNPSARKSTVVIQYVKSEGETEINDQKIETHTLFKEEVKEEMKGVTDEVLIKREVKLEDSLTELPLAVPSDKLP